MKAKYIFILLITLNVCIVFSQEYTPFPDSGAVWRDYKFLGSVGQGHLSYTSYDNKLFICGDTVIGAKYIKIFKKGYEHNFHSYYGLTDLNDSVYYSIYVGAMREDSAKHIFFLPAGATTEQLLIDFNLEIGDTIPFSCIYHADTVLVNKVVGIDSVFFAGKYRKQYIIKTSYNYPFSNWWGEGGHFYNLIEGIGYTNGLLNSLNTPQTFPNGSYLICFQLGDEKYSPQRYDYTTTLGKPTCTLHTLVSPEVKSYIVNIYPTLTRDNVIVELPDEYKGSLILIYSIDGKLIFEAHLNDNINTIEMSIYKKGIYLLQVKGKDESIIKKVVKVK